MTECTRIITIYDNRKGQKDRGSKSDLGGYTLETIKGRFLKMQLNFRRARDMFVRGLSEKGKTSQTTETGTQAIGTMEKKPDQTTNNNNRENRSNY